MLKGFLLKLYVNLFLKLQASVFPSASFDIMSKGDFDVHFWEATILVTAYLKKNNMFLLLQVKLVGPGQVVSNYG